MRTRYLLLFSINSSRHIITHLPQRTLEENWKIFEIKSYEKCLNTINKYKKRKHEKDGNKQILMCKIQFLGK